ncbi:MAG: hypothetical protein A2845_06020 [Candidatus Lloydbacteria bacterium RIFCSPHIGHO2_01_FULL_49_22]|uniref:Small-conductance mechanosensitive ion channel n=1 Tax=Candidatus Lloydbacteria bacterium RIFCSPHIGHO2_01_FULL_49_22 TaxID=1798658 RepID=A0A1G2CYJ6_9BACT|nr:MAG: hypothetical protein A2845_06020 [Candidatus Lloydbacteria bacterium RIFCSPHIGHO2_01_FULL_49_22]OGZ08800.1 MAG: hypothetical protein A3C14_01030 [Candidatus Lloydbacteria bacterium RIFCSPHIGHO2_02_FULL_50_18]
MFQSLQTVLVQSLRDVAGGVADMLPKALAALVFVILGWVFGAAVGKVVRQLVESMNADEWLKKAGVDKYLEKAGYTLNAGAFFGWLAKLFFIIVFLVAAFDILGLSQVNLFLVQVLTYIPQVLVAAIILFVASIASDLLSGVVTGATKAMGSRVSEMLGTMTRWSIWMFAFIVALSQLGIAPQYMYTIFAGFVAMLALAGGLAFGLGGKEAAAEFIRDMRAEVREKK